MAFTLKFFIFSLCWVICKQIFFNQTKSEGCNMEPVLAVKSSGSKSLAYIQSQGQWAWACPSVDLLHCSQLSLCLGGILTCGSPQPLKLSKQECSPYFLKECCWRKHLSFLFVGSADPLLAGCAVTWMQLLMLLWSMKGQCISLISQVSARSIWYCWSIEMLSQSLTFLSISPLLKLKTKPPNLNCLLNEL